MPVRGTPAAIDPLAEIIGNSAGIEAIREKVKRLLHHQLKSRRLPPILIQGETGSGKGLLARLLHSAGPRADGPFVDLNCAAIPETLLEAEMFGYERGAFTDARQPKAGLFQVANRGTLFLDEVGLLPEGVQAKLLKVIEERAVRRLGSTRSEPVDVWIVTATNEDLIAAQQKRRFREDLYQRLAVLTLWVPPLRERSGDILLLAETFLARARAEYQLPAKSLALDAKAALLAYAWPGNIRELSNVIERAVLMEETAVITGKSLGLPEPPTNRPHKDVAASTPGGMPLREAVGCVERDHLLEALGLTAWNITRAAAHLKISRDTLRYRIQKYGLQAHRPDTVHHGRPRGPRPAPKAPGALEGTAPPAATEQTSPVAAATTGIRWESQQLTFLRLSLAMSAPSLSPLASSRTLEVVLGKIRAFGGRVEELGHSGMVAIFGFDGLEDAPRHTVYAAIAISKLLEANLGRLAEVSSFRIAIHSGRLLVGQSGNTALVDMDAKGQARQSLEELLACARDNTIVVSDSAAPFLERRWHLEDLPLPPGTAWKAFNLTGREGTGLQLGRRMTRFVGRQYELELLHSRFATVKGGHGQVIGIGGEAGIGKSRLLFEFCESLKREGVICLTARCLSYGRAIPYFSIIDLIRRYSRITEGDRPETIATRIRQFLQVTGIDPEKWAPYLLNLFGLAEGIEPLTDLAPEVIKSRMFQLLRMMTVKPSQEGPMVITVEDLQWADRTSEEYFGYLVESLAGAPILFVCTYRPPYRSSWMEKSYTSHLALQPLSSPESLAVVQSALHSDSVPEPLKKLIVHKAEGNPFLLEELARSVEQHGDPHQALVIPDTIQEVILTRISRLPHEERRLLQAASVLGREFSLNLLRSIWDGPGDFDACLKELVRQEFLYERTEGPETCHVFTHALTHEVTHTSLLKPHRQALHEAAARALESQYEDRCDEVADRLAHHYSEAANADKAVQYLTRLAERAAREHARIESLNALQQAWNHVSQLPVEEHDRRYLDLTIRQASSLIPLGRFQEVRTLLYQQFPRLERLRNPSVASHFYFLLGQASMFLGDGEEAASGARRAIAEAREAGDESTMGKAYLLLAQQTMHLRQGVEHARRALELLEPAGERWWIGEAYWVIGLNYASTGELEAALEAEVKATAIAEEIGDSQLQSWAAWAIGMTNAIMGRCEEGIAACQQSLNLAPDPLSRAVALGWLGYAYFEKDDGPGATPLLEQSVSEFANFGFAQFHGWFTIYLAEARRLTGDLAMAETLALQGLARSTDAGSIYGIGLADRALGRIAYAKGDLTTAGTHLDRALHTFASMETRYDLGRVHLDLALLAHAEGDEDGAANHLHQADQLFSTLRLPSHRARVHKLAQNLSLPIVGGSSDESH